ncbi:MAG TPA: HAD hydrolase family protein [Phycisphaerales bacterium]|mgnify:CR=1 FL=1|nr:HAD hydrolase family protein [Phycisphaerales bacterium]
MTSASLSTDAKERARHIRLLALDVDGVLTDGSIMLDDHGVETKRFNVRDGQGIAAWIKMGYDVAVITKRSGQALQHRCGELGITRIVQGSQDKVEALEKLLAGTGLRAEQIAYVGDDWPDLPVLRRVGLPIAVGDADERVKAAAAMTTERPGGRGAVREAIEAILNAQGVLEKAVALCGG